MKGLAYSRSSPNLLKLDLLDAEAVRSYLEAEQPAGMSLWLAGAARTCSLASASVPWQDIHLTLLSS